MKESAPIGTKPNLTQPPTPSPQTMKKNGIGTITRRGQKGIFEARWMVDGKAYRRSTKTTDRAEAERLLKEWTAPFLLESDVATAQALAAQARVKANLSKSVPVAEIFDAWKIRHKGSAWTPGTEKVYSKMVQRFVKWMNANHPKVKEIAGVSPEIVAEYIGQEVQPGRSRKYCNDTIHAMRVAWDILQGTGDGIENPWEGKETKGDDSAEKRPFTVEELKTLIDKAPNEDWRTLVLLALYTGQRMGDVCNFRWTDIDFDHNRFNQFTQMKTKHVVRDLALHPELRAQLEKTPADKRTGYILPKFQARYAKDAANISVAFSKILDRLGLHKKEKRPGAIQCRSLTSLHSLRHTFISNAANAGWTLEQVSAVTGHISRKNAERYWHANRETIRNVVLAQPSLNGEAAQGSKTAAKLQQLNRMVADWTPEEIAEAIAELKRKIG